MSGSFANLANLTNLAAFTRVKLANLVDFVKVDLTNLVDFVCKKASLAINLALRFIKNENRIVIVLNKKFFQIQTKI